ncbi:c-type cytochrome [Candidatus Nitronereus thalassa]|uniref:C-type cytochrome n=1 Tax=Candidatus Nitronereus thalassa TaxID=3020898 RepID=A0ABU3KBK6_9BACT|nr:c-type cytochrome [Candidatus Nitronereus thalassa]MDT7043557.1 c-type cytochrome [Candidatus Nitronereus thalassa]
MAEQSLTRNIMKKGVVGVVVGIILVIAARATHFPEVFQIMFFLYAMLGALVFILLDAPSMPRLEGAKAAIGLIIFYVILSGAYIGGASILPQYDPEDEKGKIDKVLRMRRAMSEQGKAEELIARAKELNDRAASIEKQLQALGGGATVVVEEPVGSSSGAAAGDLVALGKEQWELQECYNCHKLFGQGGKKRGPILDNIGNLMTPEALREKILDPKSWMAEGFDKQYKKGKMPDKYKDLMFPQEIDALVAFLATLKDTSVDTPKPIKMN